jgi:hypothetical protein
MGTLDDLIKQARDRKKDEQVSVTVRLPVELHDAIDNLADGLGTSKQATLLVLIQEGYEQARKKLDVPVDMPSTSGSKKQKFYLLNTNRANGHDDHDWMLTHGYAAAFYEPWTQNIDRIRDGDVVFLYANGIGIVGYGIGTGQIEKQDHGGTRDACHYQKLNQFKKLENPITAANIKKTVDTKPFFMSTMSTLPEGAKLLSLAQLET